MITLHYITPDFSQTKITRSVQPFVKNVNTAFRKNSTNVFIVDTDSRKEGRKDVASPSSVIFLFRKEWLFV